MVELQTIRNERQLSSITTLSNKVPNKADSRIQTKTYLPHNQPPNTKKKQNRGPKLTEDRNCFHRNKTCQKERCTNLSECPIVAYRRDKPLKDLLVRARTPTLKKLTNSSFSRHTNILFQSLLRKTITALI